MAKKAKITILAIETSCDETTAAIIKGPRSINKTNIATPKIINNIVYSQLKLHKKTKGIVPEVASRAHVEKIITVVDKALDGIKGNLKEVDLIAVTSGPGLIGSLLVGVDTAKALSYIYQVPIIPINHLEAHIYANFVREIKNKKSKIKNIFPSIVLIVSGGHTQLILMRGHGDYKVLGSTIDDAAGEAFDKVASILGLSYPGGPAIAAAAAKSPTTNYQLPITLPRPMIDSDNLDFSFSGLKTAVLYAVKELTADNHLKITKLPNYKIAAVAAEFQQAVVDVLIAKTVKATRKYRVRTVMIGGGVASNQLLRQEMKKRISPRELSNSLFLVPDPSLCTDNAVAVGICAYYKYHLQPETINDFKKINIDPEMTL